jgi:hypothetical protein
MAAITAGEILTKFSVAAAAGNTTAGSAATSLGDQISTTQWTGGALNDLFDDISGDENAASESEYRCIFIHNTNANNIYENVVVWISAEVGGGANVSIGVDTTAASTLASGSTQALTVADENTAPGGVTFTSPTTKATGIVIGNLAVAAGTCVRAFWIKRTATNSSALSADGVTLSIAGDTGNL